MIEAQANHRLSLQLASMRNYIGNTPLFEIRHMVENKRVRLFAKLEWLQLGGSVKGRPAFEIMKNAVDSGQVDQHRSLLDASSGNTAIAYASIGATLGIPISVCLPENASEERKMILKALGANLILTTKFGSTDEAQDKARKFAEEQPHRYYYADQYNNANNWKAHYTYTANEIIEQTNGNITHFVAGLGTTGTFTGTAMRLREEIPAIQCIALQPDEALHGLEGWKHLETALVPGIYDANIADRNLEINTYEALALIPQIAKKEGLLVSPSAAANLFWRHLKSPISLKRVLW